MRRDTIGLIFGALGPVAFDQEISTTGGQKGAFIRIKTGLAQGDEVVGIAWYLSNEIAGSLKDGNESYFPQCTWLDGDRSGDGVVAAMKFSILAYGKNVAQTILNRKQCDYTLWGPDIGPIAGKPGKRLDTPRKDWMENRLVVSEIPQHKAADFCNSTTSWGPDFVGSDGMFCDMHNKTLTSICSCHDTDGCIDVDVDEKTITKRFTVAKRQVVEKHKSYGKVSQWP
ncbi:hypothetical protein TrVFT333_007637 [Trichoderma virens FT-333]|nr:hypothetical protein TrVFT333_007637 [Trichoderma virens FT-333]